MKKVIVSIMASALAVMMIVLPVRGAQDGTAQGLTDGAKLVSIVQYLGQYDVMISVRLPEMKVGDVNALTNVRTFLLQLKIEGEVSEPSFIFSEDIQWNKAITVQEYDYDDAQGIFTIIVSGTESIFDSSGGMVDLGRLKLWNEPSYDEENPPRIDVSVLDYQIVSAHNQQPVDIGYEDASDSLSLMSYDVKTELDNTLKKADSYVGEGSGLERGFAGIPVYDGLIKAYQEARSAMEAGDSVRMDAAQKSLGAAMEQFERIQGLLDVLAKARVSIERVGTVDYAEWNTLYSEALNYLKGNEFPKEAEIEKYTRLVRFESIVADLRLSVGKSRLSDGEKSRYTAGNLAAWQTAMNSAMELLNRRNTLESVDLETLADAALDAAAGLDGAYAGLIDITELNTALDRAGEILKDRGKYTESTMLALETAVTEAKEFLNYAKDHVITMESSVSPEGKILQKGYGSVLDLLKKAMDGRKERTSVAELQETVKWVESQKSADYLEEGYRSVQDSVSRAKSVIENPDSTKEQVQEALDALNKDITSLERTDGSPVSVPQVKPSATSLLPVTDSEFKNMTEVSIDGTIDPEESGKNGWIWYVLLAVAAVAAEAAVVYRFRTSRRKK